MSILSDRINTLLHPRSVAIIGASDNPSAIGYWPLYYTKLYGYAGDLFAVNPKYKGVQDVVCLPDISGLPTDLDLAVVATPKDVFLTQLRQGQWEDRAKSIVLFSSGFGEVPDHAKDEELVASLHRRGITLLGPNSIGFMTARIGLAATFTQVLQKHGPSHMAQPIAFISQSGAFGARSYSALRYAGISVAYFVSTGNEAGLGVVDFVDGAQALMDVKALFIYLENGHDGGRLLDCVDRAVGRGMKVVVLASGRSVAGQRAAASHTGAVAPEWRILRRLLEEAGAVVVDGIRDLIGAAGLLASGKRIAGRRIGIVTSSGGAGVQAADAAEERRFTVPELPRELQMRLSEHVPYFGSLRNPVDLTGSVLGGADSVRHVVSKMLHSDSVDALLVDVTKPHVGAVAAAASLSEKVVVMTMADATTDDLREMVELGVAGANDARDCLAAMEVLVERPSLRSRTEDEDIEFVDRAGRHNEGALRSSSQSPLTGTVLSYADGLRLVEDHGLPLDRWVEVTTVSDAVRSYRDLGGNVALKGNVESAAHKSELGAVKIFLGDEAGFRESVIKFLEDWGSVILHPYVLPSVELLIGGTRRPQGSMTAIIGFGGVLADLMDEPIVLSLPCPPSLLHRRLQRASSSGCRVADLLLGYRSLCPNPEIVIPILDGISSLLHLVSEVEFNPVFLVDGGTRVVAGDVRVNL